MRQTTQTPVKRKVYCIINFFFLAQSRMALNRFCSFVYVFEVDAKLTRRWPTIIANLWAAKVKTMWTKYLHSSTILNPVNNKYASANWESCEKNLPKQLPWHTAIWKVDDSFENQIGYTIYMYVNTRNRWGNILFNSLHFERPTSVYSAEK